MPQGSNIKCICTGVGSGSHSPYCDVRAGPGGRHCQAVRPGHGGPASAAPAHPPAGAAHPLTTPVLPSHEVEAF